MRNVLRRFALTMAFPLALVSIGDAGARKLDYAMPPVPAIAGAPTFKVAPPVPADAAAGETPKRGLAAVANPLYLDDERRISYRQDFGGGGVATGLLLGPFGVAANAKAIQNANERESAALRGKLPFTPGDLLGRALAARPAGEGVAVEGATVEAELAPSLFVTRDANERLIFWAIVDVSIGEWRGRYSALMPARVPLADATQGLAGDPLRGLEGGLQGAYATALDVMAADVAGQLSGFSKQRAKIEALSPRFAAMVKYDHVLRTEERVILRALAPGKYIAQGMGFIGVLIVPAAEVKFGP